MLSSSTQNFLEVQLCCRDASFALGLIRNTVERIYCHYPGGPCFHFVDPEQRTPALLTPLRSLLPIAGTITTA